MKTRTKVILGVSIPILAAVAIIYMTTGGLPVTSISQVNYVLDLNASNTNTTVVTLTVTGAPADVTLTMTDNKAHTTITANKTYWANFIGSEDVLINITKDSSETKSWRFDLNFTTTTVGGNNVSTYVESRVKSYPHLLFSDVTQTPGYINNASQPWDGWYATILAEKVTSCVGAVNQTASVGLYNITNVGDATIYIQMRMQALMTNVILSCSPVILMSVSEELL